MNLRCSFIYASILVFSVTFALVAGSDLMASDASERSAERFFKGAQDMYDNGAFMPAVDLCYKAINLKKDKRFYFLLGHSLNEAGNRALSYMAFKNAFNLIIDDAGKALTLENIKLKPGSDEWEDALDEKLNEDEDFTGLFPILVSQSIDLGKFSDAKKFIVRYKVVDPESARMASERIYLEMGRLKLEKGKYTAAYRSYAKAAQYSNTKIRSMQGCANALSGLASSLEESGENPSKLLSVLLRLYRFEDTQDTTIRIQAAFIRSGKPADKADLVKKILEAAN